MKYSAIILLFFCIACGSQKEAVVQSSTAQEEQESVENSNTIITEGSYIDLSSNNNQKIIFNGTNNTLVLEYFNALFNSENSRDVLIIEGDGNTVKIRHHATVDNSKNSCDTLIIKGEENYFDLLHEYFIDNSESSDSYVELEEDYSFEIINNVESALINDSSITQNKLTNEYVPVVDVYNMYLEQALVGNPKAAFYLGELYQMGIGTNIDNKKAEYYYTVAAEQNFMEAQSALGYLYESHYEGLDLDIEKAIYWYEKAAEKGDEYSIDRLKDLTKKL